jgi:hypothetical protein
VNYVRKAQYPRTEEDTDGYLIFSRGQGISHASYSLIVISPHALASSGIISEIIVT